MNVLAVVRLYPPRDGAGAEWYLHELLLALAAAGDSCEVKLTEPGGWVFEGICVANAEPWTPDVVITQIDGTPHGKRMAQRYGVPLVHLAHHDRQLGHKPDLQICNSMHVARRAPGALVCRPHTPAARYRTRRKGLPRFTTLINHSRAKGANIFYQLAREMPERRFLAVTGAWDAQLPPPELPNVTVWPNQPDIRKVYARTRVLLMPGVESWGRCAVEAAHNGIPTVTMDSAGMWEAMADAAVYACGDYRGALACLDNPGEYLRAAKAARGRARMLEQQTANDLERIVAAIHAL